YLDLGDDLAPRTVKPDALDAQLVIPAPWNDLIDDPEPGVFQLEVGFLKADEGIADGVEPRGAGLVKSDRWNHLLLHRGFIPENEDRVGRHFHDGFPIQGLRHQMRGQTAA